MEDVVRGNGERVCVEGKGDERRGKKRGRGLNEYSGSCACAAAGKMVTPADIIHHPCLALCGLGKFSITIVCSIVLFCSTRRL
jgi:hypothetical protein